MDNKDRLINELINVFINNQECNLNSYKEIKNIVVAKSGYILPEYTIKSRNTIKTLEEKLYNYYSDLNNSH